MGAGCSSDSKLHRVLPLQAASQVAEKQTTHVDNSIPNSAPKVQIDISPPTQTDSRSSPPTPSTATVAAETSNEPSTNGIEGHVKDDSGLFYMDATTNSTNLVAAVKRGDVENVRRILNSNNCDVNTLGMWSSTPLITACQYGFVEIAALLLSYETIDVNHINERGASALLFACLENEVSIVEALLAKGAVCSSQPASGVYNSLLDRNIIGTPLSVACVNGCSEVLTALIRAGTSVDTKFDFNVLVASSSSASNSASIGGDCLEMTPLLISSAYGRVASITVLLQQHRANIRAVDSRSNNCLHHMARSNSNSNKTAASDAVAVLIDFCVQQQQLSHTSNYAVSLDQLMHEVNDNGENALHIACDVKAVEYAKRLIEFAYRNHSAENKNCNNTNKISNNDSKSGNNNSQCFSEGARVEANYRRRGKYYPGKITRVRADGLVDISYDSGEFELRVQAESIRSIQEESVSSSFISPTTAAVASDNNNNSNNIDSEMNTALSPSSANNNATANANSGSSYIIAAPPLQHPLAEGDKVASNLKGLGAYLNGKVIKVRSHASYTPPYCYDIAYDGGGLEVRVKPECLRAITRAESSPSLDAKEVDAASASKSSPAKTAGNHIHHQSNNDQSNCRSPTRTEQQHPPLRSHDWINTASRAGATPLHIAVKRRCLELVVLLTSFGADPFIVENNASGLNALELAQKVCNNKRDKEIISVLESLAANRTTNLNDRPVASLTLDVSTASNNSSNNSNFGNQMIIGSVEVDLSAKTIDLNIAGAESSRGDASQRPVPTPTAPSVPRKPERELPPLSSSLGGRSFRRLVVATTETNSSSNEDSADKSDEVRGSSSSLPALKPATTPTPLLSAITTSTATPAKPSPSGSLSVLPLVTPSSIQAIFDATPVP